MLNKTLDEKNEYAKQKIKKVSYLKHFWNENVV